MVSIVTTIAAFIVAVSLLLLEVGMALKEMRGKDRAGRRES